MDNKTVIIIVLALALVGALLWGVNLNSDKNDLQKQKSALLVKVDNSQECIEAWGNLQGYEDVDYYGNPIWVVPEDSWASMGDDCEGLMGD